MTLIRRIIKQDIRDEVFEQMKENIYEQNWLPGTKLPSENELASMFGVSRISIRAVIQRLFALGLVETRNGEGTFVNEINAGIYLKPLIPLITLGHKDNLDIFEFRIGIEMVSNTLAAERATQEDIKMLEAVLDRWKESYIKRDLEQFAIDDYNFHLGIAKVSKNVMIEYVFIMLKEPITNHIKEMVEEYGFELNFEQHMKIFEAIKCKDGEAASHFAVESIKRSIAKIKKD